jgi:hypothetical protein
MGRIPEVKDIVDAVVYLTEASQVTAEVLHVEGGAHVGKWKPLKALNLGSVEKRLEALGIRRPASPLVARDVCGSGGDG